MLFTTNTTGLTMIVQIFDLFAQLYIFGELPEIKDNHHRNQNNFLHGYQSRPVVQRASNYILR
jgi:hypothetical protein